MCLKSVRFLWSILYFSITVPLSSEEEPPLMLSFCNLNRRCDSLAEIYKTNDNNVTCNKKSSSKISMGGGGGGGKTFGPVC
jgi:hypothetical protein